MSQGMASAYNKIAAASHSNDPQQISRNIFKKNKQKTNKNSGVKPSEPGLLFDFVLYLKNIFIIPITYYTSTH